MQPPQAGTNSRNERRSGIALVEFGVVSIVVFLMLLVTLDFGIYANAFLAIQNASRVVALRNSGGLESAADQAAACQLAIVELRGLPGIGSDFSSSCTSGVLVVTSLLCDADNPCAGGVDDSGPAVQVAVSYTLPELFHLPNVGPGVISRVTRAKVRAIP